MRVFDVFKRLFARLFGVSSVGDDDMRAGARRLRPARGSGAVIDVSDVGGGRSASPAPVLQAEFRLAARVIRSGAFEFLADSPIGEIRGRLADPDHEPAEGDVLEVVIPAEAWRLDVMAPDENAFVGELFEVSSDGGVPVFRHGTGVAWRMQGARLPEGYEPGDLLYAWVFPEDVRGHASPVSEAKPKRRAKKGPTT